MHAQLELLLEMQDLHSQMDGLREGNMREVESDLFDMNIDDAIELIAQKLVELEDRLDSEVRGRYRQMNQKGLGASWRSPLPGLPPSETSGSSSARTAAASCITSTDRPPAYRPARGLLRFCG
jgi:hypothetical protein